jgi:acetoin utilization protein AcuB
MIVEKRMTRNPITVHPETAVIDAQSLMRREKISRLPVVDKAGRLVGIVSEKDLIYASPSRVSTLDVYEMHSLLAKLTVETVMKKKVITIEGDTPVEDAARIMVDNDIGGLPVMKGGKLVGIITESDIFKMFLELFGTRRGGSGLPSSSPKKRVRSPSLRPRFSRKGGILSPPVPFSARI